MRARIRISPQRRAFIESVERLSGQNIEACYQCGRCSAGCVAANQMDLLPNQIIRMIQLGLEDELRSSASLYLCASCFVCESRCPKGIDVAKVIESLRTIFHMRDMDRIGPDQMEPDLVLDIPQQALVALYRKTSS